MKDSDMFVNSYNARAKELGMPDFHVEMDEYNVRLKEYRDINSLMARLIATVDEAFSEDTPCETVEAVLARAKVSTALAALKEAEAVLAKAEVEALRYEYMRWEKLTAYLWCLHYSPMEAAISRHDNDPDYVKNRVRAHKLANLSVPCKEIGPVANKEEPQ